MLDEIMKGIKKEEFEDETVSEITQKMQDCASKGHPNGRLSCYTSKELTGPLQAKMHCPDCNIPYWRDITDEEYKTVPILCEEIE